MAEFNLITISKQIYDAINKAKAYEDEKLAKVKKLLELASDRGISHVVDSYVDIETGNTSLHLAAQLGHEKLIKLLLEYGANREKLNAEGNTPQECLTQKTTSTTLATLINKKKVAINTSKRALLRFNLEHKQQIKNEKGDTVTVYGVTPEGELCVCVNGSSEITILKGVITRKDLVDKKYVLGNPLKPIIDKSSLIHISQKKQPETLTLRKRKYGKRIKIDCSAALLKERYNLTFMQKIQRDNYYDNAVLTVYGIYKNTLCCFVNGEIKFIPAKSFEDLTQLGYIALPEAGVIDEKLIVEGYESSFLTINSNPEDLEKVKLIPFRKYNTPSGVATLYGLSNDNDNNAILLNDKNQFLQAINPKDITPLFEDTIERLDPINTPPLESNLGVTFGKLDSLYQYALNEFNKIYFPHIVEQNEARITLNELKSILYNPYPQYNTKIIDEEQLKNALKVFLANRWDRIKDSSPLSYINNTKSLVNQLCIHIAQIIDPAHRNEILIPTLKYKDDTNGTNINQLEMGRFILTSDGEQFIDLISLHKNALIAIKEGQKNYYEIAEFHDVLMEDGTVEKGQRQRNLNDDEITRLHTVPFAKEFDKSAKNLLEKTEGTALGALANLRERLIFGDSTTNYDYEYDSGDYANMALQWFSKLYENMPPIEKAKLNKLKLLSPLGRETEQTLGDLINDRLLISNPGLKDINGDLSANYCLAANGRKLEEAIGYHRGTLRNIRMVESDLFEKIGTDQLDTDYLKVINALENPEISTKNTEVTYTIADHIKTIPENKIEFQQYLKAIINNTLKDEPTFLKNIKKPLIGVFNIPQAEEALEKYLDYPPETKRKLINFLLDRPIKNDLCLAKIKEISSTYIDESNRLLTELLFNRNLCDIKFSEDYLKIISRFTELYGEDAANKMNEVLVGKASKQTYVEPHVIYLRNKIDTTIKILSDKNVNMVKNNLLGMACTKELLSNLLSILLANNLSENELNEIKRLQFIFARKCEGPMLTDLIRSELKKIDTSENFKNLIQKFILEAKSPTNEEIFSLNKLIHTSRNRKDLSSDLENLIHLLLNKDINIDQNRTEYKTLVYKIKSTLIPKKEILPALKHILSTKPISDDLKSWVMDFAKAMVIKQPEESINDAIRFQKKKNSKELIISIINGLKEESISLESSTRLQDLIHNKHALLSSLEDYEKVEIISNAAIGLNPIIVSNLNSSIPETQLNNQNQKADEIEPRTINIKLLLSRLVPMILNQHKSLYENAGIFRSLINNLHHQNLSRKETKEIIREEAKEIIKALELFPNQLSKEIDERITNFLVDISTSATYRTMGVDTAEKIRLDHCSHEKLRTEVKKLVSQEINNLEKIKDNLNVNKDSGSSFDKYNAAHQTIFEAALGDKNNPAPGTLHNLHASLDSGTINLTALKIGIETITREKLITPFVTLDEDTSTIYKVRHWVQNMFSRLDRFLFKQQKSSTIDIKDAQRSLTKNCNAFFNKRSLDQPKAREAVGPVIVAITA